jgi:hypothetical protein
MHLVDGCRTQKHSNQAVQRHEMASDGSHPWPGCMRDTKRAKTCMFSRPQQTHRCSATSRVNTLVRMTQSQVSRCEAAYLQAVGGQTRAAVDADCISLYQHLQPWIKGTLENKLQSLDWSFVELLPGDRQHELGQAELVLGGSSRPLPALQQGF